MSDALGLLPLPVEAPIVYPPDERTRAPGDPALELVGSFAATVLQANVGAAWERLSPGKPDLLSSVDASRAGTTAARRVLFDDPRRGYFNEADLPALFVYRGATTPGQWFTLDCQRRRGQILLTLVLPPTTVDQQLRERATMANAFSAALHDAFQRRRHPSWVVDGDLADEDALLTTTATSTSPVTLTSFNGAQAGVTMVAARPITITTAIASGAYNITDPIVVTGPLGNGETFAESIYLTNTNGGETIPTIFPFGSPTSIALPAMLLTTGSYTIGYDASPDTIRGTLLQRAAKFAEMRVARGGALTIKAERVTGETATFEAYEIALEIAEDGYRDPALVAHDPWDIEAHGLRSDANNEEIFEFLITG